jgi:hypothetical protein
VIRGVEGGGTDLHATAKALRDLKGSLQCLGTLTLSETAETLAKAAESLRETQERMERCQPEEWLTPDQAGRHLGCSSVAAFERVVAKEGIPKHYLSDRLPRYSRSELDAWLRSR